MIIEFLKKGFSILSTDTITSLFVSFILLITFSAIVYVYVQTKKWNRLIENKDFTSLELKGL